MHTECANEVRVQPGPGSGDASRGQVGGLHSGANERQGHEQNRKARALAQRSKPEERQEDHRERSRQAGGKQDDDVASFLAMRASGHR